MKDTYDDILYKQFKDLEINLVKHDDSPTGLPCYIEAHLGYNPKDKGALVLDLGNYIGRKLGLRYQHIPEYRGRGKKTTVRWFMSWDDVEPILPSIFAAEGANPSILKHGHYLPFGFRNLIVQNNKRGVRI